MERFDREDQNQSFESIMRGFDATHDERQFSRAHRFLLDHDIELEDVRPAQGVLETHASIYKVLENTTNGEAVVSEIAILGASAFAKRKNFLVLAPDLPQDLEYKILALGHADYFSFRKIEAILATSEMQVARLLQASVSKRWGISLSPAQDRWYWTAAVKTVAWILIAVAFYLTLRHRFPRAYGDVIAIFPFWLRAFYGAAVPNSTVRDFREPKWRLVEVNKLVAPVFALILIIAISVAPDAVAVLGIAALGIDFAGFFSPRFTRAVARYSTRLPSALR